MIVQIWSAGHRGLIAVIEAKSLNEGLRQYAEDAGFRRPRINGVKMKAHGKEYFAKRA